MSVGARVRIPATRFESTAPDDFGADWRSAYYYGTVHGLNARTHCLNIKYSLAITSDEGPYASHFSHVEVGSSPDGDVELEQRRAIVLSRATGGAAHRNHIRVGFTFVRVGDIDTPTLESVTTALARSNPSKERPLTVVLRRPPPDPKSWRGAARSAAHRRPAWVWHDDVAASLDELLKDPALNRRSNKVYEKLKHEYGHSLDDEQKMKLPPLKDVESRMLALFKRKKQQERDHAQDKAARAVARAAGGDVDQSDDDTASDSGDDADDGDTPMADADGSVASEGDDVEMHFGSLDGVSVSVLRQRLRASGNTALATVKNADLPAGTGTGPEKSAATCLILRRRLAGVLAACADS